MPEQIVNILNKIVEAKGAEYAKGFVDGVNLTTPEKATEEKNQPAYPAGTIPNHLSYDKEAPLSLASAAPSPVPLPGR